MLNKGICASILLLIISGLSVADDELINNDEAAGTIITKGYLVEDMYGHQNFVSRKLLVNGDGTYTSISGGRSDNLKAIHEEFCQDIGQIDDYDNAAIFVPNPEQEVKLCADNPNLTLDEKIEAIRSSVTIPENQKEMEIKSLKQDSLSSTSTIANNPKLSLTPYNSFTQKSKTYTIKTVIEYTTTSSTKVLTGGIEKKSKSACSTSIRYSIPKNTTGKRSMLVSCLAPDYQAVQYYSATAQMGILSESAKGTITIGL